jgi:kojibiose phosphorylase
MLDHGLPMVLETARFWASRVSHDEATDSYSIRLVIGPNEFQEGVDNNSYTNAMARWTLRYASELYSDFMQRHPGEMQRIAQHIGLSEEEVRSWERIADEIVLLMGNDGLLEEFQGYFDRRDVTITEWDEHGMPVWPAEVLLKDVMDTQLVKQADVVLLLYLLSDEFSSEAKRVNLDYYEPRTTHMSSLSIASHAILASELGDTEKAYRYLRRAASSDLEDIHGNTNLGVHAAELGGVWQIIVRGLAGLRVRAGVLSVDPRLPEHWERVRFRTWFRDRLLALAISQNEVAVYMEQGTEAVELDVCGERKILEPGGTTRVKR